MPATPSIAQRPWITSEYASHCGLTNPPAPSGSDMPSGVEAEVARERAVEVRHVLVGDAHEVEVVLGARLRLGDRLGGLLGGGRFLTL